MHITWFGGEPLLCYDEIIQMGKIIKLKLHSINVSLDSSIVTNGVLLSRERVVGLKENCSLSSVQISLDGLEDEYCKKKNCSIQVYERLMRNIKEIRPLIKLCIRLNTDKNNLKDMYALADYFYDDFNPSQEFKLYFAMLRDYSYGTIKNIPFFSLVEYQEEKRKFYNYLIEKGYIAKERNEQGTVPIHKPIYCNLSRVSNYAIGSKGELYKCEHHFGQKDKIIGDVVNGLYYNEFYFEQMYHTHDQLCEKCSMYPICQTSCPEIRKLVQVVNGRCMRYDQVYQRVTIAVKQYLSSE